MNKTNDLTIFRQEEPEDKFLAQKYFKNLYGDDIDYLEKSDSYLYRGIEFDYFKSSVPICASVGPTFLLVDKEYCYLWVFTHGDKEEMWEDYCRIKYEHFGYEKEKGFWRRLFGK